MVLPCPPPQEAANTAVLVLQSIFWGSEGIKVTPSPLRKAIQESKQVKPRLDCTYCTGKSGLNLWTEEIQIRRSALKVQGLKYLQTDLCGT